MTRYHLDPLFQRTSDGAVIGIICYDIYLDGRFIGSRRTHAQCHRYLDEILPSIPERAGAAQNTDAPDRDAQQRRNSMSA